MKNILLAALALSAAALSHGEYQKLDSIVAIVDENVVTESDVRHKTEVARQNLAQQQLAQMPDEQEIRQQVINRLILENLQLQMAERGGISVTDEQLNQAMQTIASRNGFDLAGFRAELEKQGIAYYDMREQIRQDIMIQQVQQGHLRSRIQVTEAEVDNFLSSAEGRELTAVQYRLAHVLLPVNEQASPRQVQQARQDLLQIRQQIIQGQLRFDELVNGKKVGNHSLSGTDFGWQKREQLPSLFGNAASGMSKGDISEPLRSGAGWHLLLLADSRGGSETVHQQRARHILIQPSEVRTDEQAEQLARQLYERILQGEDFALMAREYSEDKGSALAGGDLDWSGPGQFVPAFEQTLDALQVDEISAPVETRYGWHIIQKTGERDHDVTRENQRQQAYQILYERKFADELDNWLVKIREEAFVELK